MSAAFAHWTRRAHVSGETDIDDGVIMSIMTSHPKGTLLALRTGGVMRLPINDKRRDIKALMSFGLPAGIGSDRADKRDLMIVLTGDQVLCRHLPRINYLLRRQ